MRFCKQLFSIVSMIAVLSLPFAMMGCAEQSAPAGGGANTTADSAADTTAELGEPEGGSALP